jgi:outer membrane protein TolC
MTSRSIVLALSVSVLAAGTARAQNTPVPDLFLHGVPTGTATGQTLGLSLADAIARGLQHNLAVVMQQSRSSSVAGQREKDLAALLPHVSGGVRQSGQVVNLAAFGFSGIGDFPQLIGPFGVFDARLFVSSPLYDAEALGSYQQSKASVTAEAHADLNIRELVVLAVGNLYLEAVADEARVASARSEVATAEQLERLAEDQRAAGVVAGIDVLRQQVQLESARARLITASNTLEKEKLRLARAIGLPLDQPYTLADHPSYTPAPPMTLEEALKIAYATREDLQSAQSRVDAAEASRRSARGSELPSVHVNADIGALGSNTSTLEKTYTVAADVRVPIFDGGTARGKLLQADADLNARQSELEDLRAGIRADVTAAMLDLNAADAAVQVAQSAQTLAREQLTQAQDRVRAGVTNTIELAQAQEAEVIASERYIASVHAHLLAKAAMARALGQVQQRFLQLVGGQQ